MAYVEIRDTHGDSERHRLSRKQPVSFGSNSSNDVVVDEAEVPPLHCRISYKDGSYEVAAANPDGISVNGEVVRHSSLRNGDVIAIGSREIHFSRDKDNDEPAASVAATGKLNKGLEAEKEGDVGLRPLTEEINIKSWETGPRESPAEEPAEVEEVGDEDEADDSSSKRKRRRSEKSEDESVDEDRKARRRRRKRRKERERRRKQKEDTDDPYGFDDEESEPKSEKKLSRSRSHEEDAIDESAADGPGIKDRLKERRQRRAVRPGEQDVIRSPLILSLGAFAAVLALAAAVFYLINSRQSSRSAYDAAASEMKQGKYTQAERLYEEFIRFFPDHDLNEQAWFELAQARVLRYTTGGTPDWEEGLAQLQGAVRDLRDRPDFSERQPFLRESAETIALGAAKSAGAVRSGGRELLAVSDEASTIIDRYSDPENPPVEIKNRIQKVYRDSEAKILKQETIDAAVAQIEQSLEDNQTLAAFDDRRALLTRYPEIANSAQMTKLLDTILTKEQSLTTVAELSIDGAVAERLDLPKPTTMALHTRSRTDQLSEGRSVLAIAKDSCFGVDSVTGEPNWRRVVGLETPFFPIPVSTDPPGALLYDTNFYELVAIDHSSGELLWRQPFATEADQSAGEVVSGEPIVHENQVYLPTLAGHLYKIDLSTGRTTGRIDFPQPLAGSPALFADSNKLIVAGEREVFYTVSLRPFACEAVSYIGQPVGAIDAPLLSMGALLLSIENSDSQRALLRVFDTRGASGRVQQVATNRIDGLVQSPPILRGKDLFVPSGNGRITAFSVSDDEGQRPLTQIASVPLQTDYNGPLFLAAGPDGQIWMAADTTRKFYLKTESIEPDQRQIAPGISSQPIQVIGEQLYLGRHRGPGSRAVLVTQADRGEMTSPWRLVIGAKSLAETSSGDNSLVSVSENGDVFRLSASELTSGGFRTSATSTLLERDETLQQPLAATRLASGTLVVWSGAPNPRLWSITNTGLVEQQISLAAPVEVPPVLIDAGLVVPLSGRLKILNRTGQSAADDFVAPFEQSETLQWRSVLRIDNERIATLDSSDRLAVLEFRTTPTKHLAQTVSVDLTAAVDFAPIVVGNRIVLADAQRNLQLLDGTTLDILAEQELSTPASGPLHAVGDFVAVETGDGQISVFDTTSDLAPVFQAPLTDETSSDIVHLAGGPVIVEGRMVVATSDGHVGFYDASSGEKLGAHFVNQPADRGPVSVGPVVAFPTIDGSFHQLGPLQDEGQ